ncbi:MAG: thermonuclease family protein [Hyphomicrobiales bacterium]|nr:thermonuclease family protein [Hyphomicrobiales bacterium]MDE2115782.1 thermonuclease family protein [Hyphomicrobiales bacterium]
MRVAGIALLVCGFWQASALAQMPQRACGAGQETQAGLVSAITPHLALQLNGGRRIQLAGIEIPDWHTRGQDFGRLARKWLQDNLVGQKVAIDATQAGLDRWRRVPAIVHVAKAGSGTQSVQARLLQAGLAQVWARAVMPCRDEFLASETLARRDGLGIWSDDDHAEVDASRPDAFKGLRGHDIVVRGRVVSVQTVGYRTYIRFGPRKFHDLAAIILKPDMKAFAHANLPPSALPGHVIRVRGRLSMRFGPQIEIAGPAQVEVTDALAAGPPTPGVKSDNGN